MVAVIVKKRLEGRIGRVRTTKAAFIPLLLFYDSKT